MGLRLLRGLALACHPGPTFVVTVAVTAVAASLGRTGFGVLAVAVAVLLGQLSVGWSNDAVDTDRDVAADRSEKPIVRGLVSLRTVRMAALAAAVLCIPMSYVAAGPVGGSAHIVAVALAWSYNLWLKTTMFSVVPYILSFGLVAPFLTYGLQPSKPPATWFVITMASIGVAAGMSNGIPDIDGDRDIGAGGLVARIGARAAGLVAVGAVVLATILLVLKLDLASALTAAVLVAAIAVALAGAVVAQGKHLFAVVMVLALADTALLCFVGASAVVRL